MIPSIVARQVRETILDYLRTTFALADPGFEDALFDYLAGDNGLFRGPYFDIRLPFSKAKPDEVIPLEIRPDFDPYRHQMNAFDRLYSRDDHQPEHTLVTTGTGSGKTECFLYPILDHCYRNQGKPGIKAVILYPMNALASDQSRRLAEMLWSDKRLHGKVTAGLFVGGKGQHGVADREHLVDKREVLRASPPDILLTNYKMLDFLLLRPEDRKLWQHNGPDTLRYLVLDELHTYDGAQGSDVACLTRRLKRRLGCAPGTVCGVGTSATIGSSMQDDTIRALTGFAQKVFNEDFTEESVITENRQDAVETLGEVVDIDRFPPADRFGELEPEAFDDASEWLQKQAELWLGDGGGQLLPPELGDRLARHDFLRQLLRVLGGTVTGWDELDAGLLNRVPEWEEFEPALRKRMVESFIALVSRAKREVPTADGGVHVEPFLTVSVHVWLRELRHLVQKVDDPEQPVSFAWSDEGISAAQKDDCHWLPMAHCRECGGTGLATYQREGEDLLQSNELGQIGARWLRRDKACRYVAYGHGQELEEFPKYLCPNCLRVQMGPEAMSCNRCFRIPAGGGEGQPIKNIPVRVADDFSDQQRPRFLERCPDCGAERALSMLGSRAASLLSVSISHLYQSDYNEDKKLLAFTDSVQDASHRAGFFGARTYRFNLRTAIQGAIDAQDGKGVALSDLADKLWGFWKAEFDSRGEPAKLIATLLPSDLRELPSYERFVDKKGRGKHVKLENQLRQRLSWEAVMEYGLNSRVGRTLENTQCSTVEIDVEGISRVAEILFLDLQEDCPLDSGPPAGLTKESVEHFLAGLTNRMRLRGGIDHELLRAYAKNEGNWYLLTKRKQPLMSPFRRESVLPRFLSDRTRKPGSQPVFDTFVSESRQLTWYRDWAERALGVPRTDTGINELYREAVKRLEGEGLLVCHELTKSGHAWALSPARLTVTSNVGQVVCSQCRRGVTLAARELELWSGKQCTRYRCSGKYQRPVESEQTYYGRIYRSGRLERIYSHEHTGLLEREEREDLEERFKSPTMPGDPNLFVCTPTLEMGIDIGDLSGTVLCSVPPRPASYLQRVGRAGRKTGNALTLAMANSRPHDLYFHNRPEEMMAGQVLPPGCFLDAPEMLRRQMVAHAMDSWAAQDEKVTKIPARTSFILAKDSSVTFPGRFLDYYRANRKDLTQSFLDCFGDYLSPHNRERLEEYALGNHIPEAINGAFDQIAVEVKDLRNHQQRARKRIQEIENDPDTSEDADDEKDELRDAIKMLGRLGVELSSKYPLNVLTDEGLLPNYAFPEPGVKLESVIGQTSEDGERHYSAHEYIRPASSAIRELAPFNTFYADGRKVRINEVDIGSKARPMIESWRLCPECNHMRIETAGQALEDSCPRCQDPGWIDGGQCKDLIHFRRSRSLAGRLESSTADDTEDREETFYDITDLIDVGPEHYNGAKLIDDIPFGYELLKGLKLREINFGPNESDLHKGLRVAGEEVRETGFVLCADCGRVRENDGKIWHAAGCRARKTAIQEQHASIFLYREIESEAIRILLPVSEVGLDRKRAAFKAALQLGFRRHFEGDPGHLIVRSVREPTPGGYAARQYLVVFDGVPGGTGYLSELWQEDNFLEVLDKALAAMQGCSCSREPDRDGCYRCLFAYQSQRDLALISSKEAQEILRDILDKRDSLKTVRTLSEVSLESKLESELESKFLEALKDRAESTDGMSWEEKIRGGEPRWIINTGTLSWEIQAQPQLGGRQGVAIASRPDFLIRPTNADPEIKPVAVFCDGLAYHALPDKDQGRIGDDIEKRTAIIESGKYQVWSITWKDVVDFEKGPHTITSMLLFGTLDNGKLGSLINELKCQLERSVGQRGSMEMMLCYLTQPQTDEWEKLARAYTLTWLSSVNQWLEPEAGARIEQRLGSEPAAFKPGPCSQVGVEADVFTRDHWDRFFSALARSTRDSFRDGRVDRFLLRLFDEKEARSSREFESSWRSFLQVWNLLQFYDGLSVVSSELIASSSGITSGGAYPQADLQEVAEVAQPGQADKTGEHSVLKDLLEYATDFSRPLIQATAEASIPLPSQGYELEVSGAGCGPEAELAWPDYRIAVLAGSQAEDRQVFEQTGWTVLVQPVSGDQLLGALKNNDVEQETSSL